MGYWKGLRLWLVVVANLGYAGWSVSAGDALSAALFSAIGAFLAAILLSRWIWAINDEDAEMRFGRFWRKVNK
jgi:cytochrome b